MSVGLLFFAFLFALGGGGMAHYMHRYWGKAHATACGLFTWAASMFFVWCALNYMSVRHMSVSLSRNGVKAVKVKVEHAQATIDRMLSAGYELESRADSTIMRCNGLSEEYSELVFSKEAQQPKSGVEYEKLVREGE